MMSAFNLLRKIKYNVYTFFQACFSDLCYLSLFQKKKYSNDQFALFANLRVKCHILDKGLWTEPFQTGHGENVYQEAKSLVKRITDSAIFTDAAYQWCLYIMKQYEEAQITGNTGKEIHDLYLYSERERKEIVDFITSSVSCRSFLDKKIDNDILYELVKIASTAPNSCCRQTTRAYIVLDNSKIAFLNKHIVGATGFSNGIPHLLCITSDIRSHQRSERFFPYIDSSIFLQNFALGCRAYNIFSVILSFQYATQSDIKEVKKCLAIPEFEKPIIFMAFGYPAKVPKKPDRMNVKFIGQIC
jgi:nitroreductase